MYLDHFKLSCRPFEETPDHRFLYLSAQHARALANIEYALTNRDSFVVISGEIGMGKTTLLNRVFDDMPNGISVARVAHTTLKPTELLHKLLGEFGIETYKKNKVYLLEELRRFFVNEKQAGRQIAILVDEAQNLSISTLEELRLLSSMDLSLAGLVSVVLVGQPNLNDLVDSPKLRQLRQRVRLRQHLLPLNKEETCDYIDRRLDVAGSSAAELFSEDATDRVFFFTDGVPRLINTLCDAALTASWTEEEQTVSAERIDTVAAELGWPDKESTSSDPDTGQTGNQFNPAVTDSCEAPRTVYGWLRQSGPENDEFWVPILNLPFTIGRTANNRLQLRNPHISRTHAVIEKADNGTLCINDQGSRNGTFVNAMRIDQAPLNDGDRLAFGNLELTFHMRVEASALSTS